MNQSEINCPIPVNERKLDVSWDESVITLTSFSHALGAELDALGYPAAPKRATTLAKDLGLGRTQAFRLLKGLSVPNLDSMAALRAMGVSMDRILDRVTSQIQPTVDVQISGQSVPAVVQKNPPGAYATVMLVPSRGGQFELLALQPGTVAPDHAVAIQGLQFPIRSSLAIVEDDAATLATLGQQMGSAFRVAQFALGMGLLNSPGLLGYSAFLIDWRLPDIDGHELVARLRKNSLAPIFVLTGDKSASASIAKALDFENVHHVAKPADEIILIKRILHAIGHAR